MNKVVKRMRKKLVSTLITVVFILCFTTLAYAGSTAISFSGGNGFILINTTAPGIANDSFEVDGGGSFSANQLLSTSSPTVIIRNGEFSGGGFIGVATDTTDPQVKFEAYLSSDDSGWLGQAVDTTSSAEFQLSAGGRGRGNLEIYTNTGERLDFEFYLIYDASTMNTIANADPFHLGWITQFDSNVQIDGGALAH